MWPIVCVWFLFEWSHEINIVRNLFCISISTFEEMHVIYCGCVLCDIARMQQTLLVFCSWFFGPFYLSLPVFYVQGCFDLQILASYQVCFPCAFSPTSLIYEA